LQQELHIALPERSSRKQVTHDNSGRLISSELAFLFMRDSEHGLDYYSALSCINIFIILIAKGIGFSADNVTLCLIEVLPSRIFRKDVPGKMD
jgi:hypothetical protein